MRFLPSPHDRADAIAALTLVRALTHRLTEAGTLSAEDVKLVRADALAELETGKGPIIEQARKLVEQENPQLPMCPYHTVGFMLLWTQQIDSEPKATHGQYCKHAVDDNVHLGPHIYLPSYADADEPGLKASGILDNRGN